MNNPSIGPRVYLVGQILPAICEVRRSNDMTEKEWLALVADAAVTLVDAVLDRMSHEPEKV